MPYIDVEVDDSGTTERIPVTVTAVHEDGTYDYTSPIASGYRCRSPLFDKDGQPVEAALSIEPAQTDRREAVLSEYSGRKLTTSERLERIERMLGISEGGGIT